MNLENLIGKKIAILGLGQEGLSTAGYLSKHNLRYSILDDNDKLAIPSQLAAHLDETFLGSGYLKELGKFDIIFRGPGIRLSLPALQKEVAAGKMVTSQTKFFFDNCPAPIIGVTGTKGKGTTASLIYEILKKAGKNVLLGGNIGVPPLDFLDEIQNGSWVVLELSSFQLVDLDKSPRIGVVLMVTSDHLDYHLTDGAYWDAKSNIVSHQNENDFALLNHDSAVALSFAHKSSGKIIYFSRKGPVNPGVFLQENKIMTHMGGELLTLLDRSDIKLIGDHNIDNVTAAAAAAKVVGVDNEVIKLAVRDFTGLPHRLQLCDEVDGVRFYDDSASTNPETTIAAIQSFHKPEVLILGGSSKGADFTKLGGEIALNPNIVGVILIGQEGPRIEEAIKRNGTFTGFVLTDIKDMKEAVTRAKKLATHGGVVVLSPACASFDMFKNYSDRGDRFQLEVKLLHENSSRQD